MSAAGSEFLVKNVLSAIAVAIALAVGIANPFIGVVVGMVGLGIIWNVKLD